MEYPETENAPIVVFVYDRLSHLKKCIGSLAKNQLAGSSVLFVVSDAASSDEDRPKIDALRDHIRSIEGFLKVIPVIREKNLGPAGSPVKAIKDILDIYGSIIFMEDDIEVAPNFLKYMNDALMFYGDDKRIFSISGWSAPVRIPDSYGKDVYLWQRFGGWGAATWKDRWDRLDLSLKDYDRFWKDKKAVLRYYHINPPSLNSLIAEKKRDDIVAVDSRINFHMFMKNMYTVYPVISKTRNTGFDGSGANCGLDISLTDQFMDPGYEPVSFVEGIKTDKDISRLVRKWHMLRNNWNRRRLIKILLKSVCKRFFEIISWKRAARG